MGGFFSNFKCCHCFTKPNQDGDNLNFTDLTGGLEEKKTYYSWDVREKPPPCIIDSVENCNVLRNPVGQQLIIRNCKSAQIYILDWTTCATIDDCQDCIIVVAAVGGSLFLRGTKATTLVSASTQLRLRDCSEITLFSACESDPIIESCQNIQVAPYCLYYDKIQEHFQSAKLDPFKATHWAQVYDFTPPANDMTQPNWKRLKDNPHEINASRFIPRPPPSSSASPHEEEDNENSQNGDTVQQQQRQQHHNNKYSEDTTSGFNVGSNNSFVPITQDMYSATVNPNATLVLIPDESNYRVQALHFIQRSSSSSSSSSQLLSTSVVPNHDVEGGGKIALLFASTVLPDGLANVNVNGTNVVVTTDKTMINRYFSNNRHG